MMQTYIVWFSSGVFTWFIYTISILALRKKKPAAAVIVASVVLMFMLVIGSFFMSQIVQAIWGA